MCIEIGNVLGVATSPDKSRGNTVAGHRLLVNADKKVETHSEAPGAKAGAVCLKTPQLESR